jgi:hypothetical protein
MRSAFRHGAIMLALVGVVGLAAANHIAAEELSEPALGPTLPDDETTGSIDRSAITQSLPLSDEQRGIIFLGVINLPDLPDADLTAHIAIPMETFESAALPDAIDLHDMPAMVVRKIPLLLDHKFVKLDDRILVVRPADRMVVAEIPRYRILP